MAKHPKWCDKSKPQNGYGFIYALYDPQNPGVPRYVGRTTQPLLRRMARHKCWIKSHSSHPLSIWINSLLICGSHPIGRVLENVGIPDLQKREEAWIKFFKPLGLLANRSDGNGSKGLKLGPPCLENRLKTIERNKRGQSEATKLKLSLQRIGKPISPEAREKWMQHPKYPVIQNKFRECNELRKKPVICETDGREFDSVADAAKSINHSSTYLRKAIQRGRIINGLRFIFKGKEVVSV